MSEESRTPDLVELVRKQLKAMNRGDIDAFVEVYAPDSVLDTAGYGMGTYVGPEAIRGFLREWAGSFNDLKVEADEIVDLGRGVVLTIYHQEGRPVGGNNYVRVSSAFVGEFVGGMAMRGTVYADIDEARAAAERLAETRG